MFTLVFCLVSMIRAGFKSSSIQARFERLTTFCCIGTCAATDLTNDTTPNDDVLAEASFSSFTPAGTVLDYTTVSGGGAGESYYGWTLQIEQELADGNVADTAAAADSWFSNVDTSELFADGSYPGEAKEGSAIVSEATFKWQVRALDNEMLRKVEDHG